MDERGGGGMSTPAPDDVQHRLDQLARAWDEAASGYDAYFVPRFSSWAVRAVDALDRLPPGTIAIPCCGTGPEILLLAERYPERHLLGIDLSSGMADRARQRVADRATVEVRVGDASDLCAIGSFAGVLSVFGLQQMPAPAAAIASWGKALVPDGVLSVVYWPEIVEEVGPFAWLRAALAGRVPSGFTWEEALVPALGDAGLTVVRDQLVSFEMVHDCADSFWDAAINSGPGRTLAARGEAFLRDVRGDFMRYASSGPILHRPTARHIVAERRESP
jgi:SAM-dependent methyltransferase